MKKHILAFSISGMLLAGCYNDSREELYPTPAGSSCDTARVTYAGFIAPLMRQSCSVSACHDNGTASFNIVLDNYDGVREIALNGKLLGSIQHQNGFYPMPKNTEKLDSCSIVRIRAWVSQGAPEN